MLLVYIYIYIYIYIFFKYFLVGQCMCVKTLYDSSTGLNYILGGFEDGNIVIWDERKSAVCLNHCQLFSGAGKYHYIIIMDCF